MTSAISDGQYCVTFVHNQIWFYLQYAENVRYFMRSGRAPVCWQPVTWYSVELLSTTGSAE